MAFYSDANFVRQLMDPSQMIFWDGMGRPNYSYYCESDSDSDGIPGEILANIVKAKKATTPNQLCKFYQRGNCRYGGQCRFLHTYGDGHEQAMDICVFYQRGNCRYGENCHFRHSANLEQDPVEAKSQVTNRTFRPRKGSVFAPSDEDLRMGRLTRIKMCFDLPIKDSLKLDRPQNLGCSYYIDIFVDKRDDDVQYLYDVIEQKAENPLYRKGMFHFSKPGANLDLSDTTKKLSATSIFIFGSSIDVLLTQSYSLTVKVLGNEELVDKKRYAMSTLPRNENGSFKDSNLQALLKRFPTPDLKKCDMNANQIGSGNSDAEEPSRLHRLFEDVGKHVRMHNEAECNWCLEKGCGCLVTSNEDIESDDSELSCQSSDLRKGRPGRSKFECGAYPDVLDAKKIPLEISLKFGDIVTFGECPSVTVYIVGEDGILTKLEQNIFFTIPFQISSQFKDPIKKYQSVFKQASSNTGELMGVYIHHDDPHFVETFGGQLPPKWKCCFVAKCGPSETDVSLDHFKIEVDESNFFTAVPPDFPEGGCHVNCIDDIYQRGQSLKESANFAAFEIELALMESERVSLKEKHGMLHPRIATWFSRCTPLQGSKGSYNVTVNWQGPVQDENVVKAIIEEFYESFTWRYSRTVDPNSC